MRTTINGRWCDPSDVRSALVEDQLVQAISETIEDSREKDSRGGEEG